MTGVVIIKYYKWDLKVIHKSFYLYGVQEAITPSGSSHWPSSLDIKIVKRFLRSSQENGQHYQKSVSDLQEKVILAYLF